MQQVLEHGVDKSDRTGTGTRSIFGCQMRFDLSQGFPLLTTKKVFMRGIIHELLWFLQGSTNIKYLIDNDVHIWDDWPYRAYLMKQGKRVPTPNSEEWNDGIRQYSSPQAQKEGEEDPNCQRGQSRSRRR